MRKMISILMILAVLLCACTQGTDLSMDSPSPAPLETMPADTPEPSVEATPSPEASPAPEATLPPVVIEFPQNLKEMIGDDLHPMSPQPYEELTDEEKADVAEMDALFADNGIYEISLEPPENKTGAVKYDFNGDGLIETLSYQLFSDGLEDDLHILMVSLGKSSINCMLGQSQNSPVAYFRSIGICDIDKEDGAIDFFITKVSTNGIFETTSIYRLNGGNDIVAVAGLDTGLSGVSGDGKIYYWGGNLKETPRDRFNPDYVISYYDIALREYVDTDQIVGKTFTDLGGWLLFEDKADVPTGAPVEMTEDQPGVIRRLEPGTEVTVLEMPENDVVKVETGDGTVGWLGGFHMVWD